MGRADRAELSGDLRSHGGIALHDQQGGSPHNHREIVIYEQETITTEKNDQHDREQEPVLFFLKAISA